MEVDRIRYIFGSFTRKKDKRKSLEQSSISAGNSPLHGKTRPISNLNIAPRTSAYDVKERRKSVKEWDCKLCGKGLAEPRLLACLHSFCTRCLQDLPQDGAVEVWAEDGGKSRVVTCVKKFFANVLKIYSRSAGLFSMSRQVWNRRAVKRSFSHTRQL